MENRNVIQLFVDQPTRAAWDAEKEEWFFFIVTGLIADTAGKKKS